jgi:hypothetical protein
VSRQKEQSEGEQDRDDDCVLAVDGDKLQADGARQVQQGSGAQILLGEHFAAKAKPQGQ